MTGKIDLLLIVDNYSVLNDVSAVQDVTINVLSISHKTFNIRIN